MAKVTLKGNAIHTEGNLPSVGSTAPNFTMVNNDLSETSLTELSGKKILSIFPSVDTGTCATSVREFNKRAASLDNVTVINVSKDLPFAQKRFCGAEGIEKAITASVFNSNFSKEYQVDFSDGPLKGLCSRAVLVLDENNKVIYAEQVAETADEPNYEAALAALS